MKNLICVICIWLVGSNVGGQALYESLLLLNNTPAVNLQLIQERFEETDTGGALGSPTDGYDSDTGDLGVVSTETGTVDPDATDRNIGDTGNQSFKTDATAATATSRFVFASQTRLMLKFKFQIDALPSVGTAFNIMSLRDGSGNVMGQIAIQTDGAVRVYNGSTQQTTVSTVVADTTYYGWQGWTSSGTAEFSFSITDSRPTSGNSYASVTGGSGTTAVTRVQPGAEFGNLLVVWFDDVFLNTLTYEP